MNKPRFTTIPDEMLHVAEGVYRQLTTEGYRVSVEFQKIEFPRTPSLQAKRGHTTLLIEVTSQVEKAIALAWTRYGHSCDSDTQFAFAIPNQPGASQGDMEFCAINKVGLLTFDVAGSGMELIPPIDLGMRIELPELSKLPPKVRAAVATSYKKFERGDWRDGLADGCLAVEDRARRYLKGRISKPGVRVLSEKGKPLNLTNTQIEKATLGALGKYFLGISSPNALDSLLAKTIPIINPERIGTVHKRHSASVEKKLRSKAGQRMYAAINCLQELLK